VRIAIVGGGISGLLAARLLSRRHETIVYEAGAYAGGHTNTIEVTLDDGTRHAVDTGFIVFNNRTYPHFTRLLAQLGVATLDTDMSFSVACERTGLEYSGTSLNTLFAQRRNALSPSFLGMVRDILRFNRCGAEEAIRTAGASVDGFLTAHRYGARFKNHYLVPMGAAIWSCPPHVFLGFPIRFVMEFFDNHGLLHVTDRPVWKVVQGGSARYVEALTAPFKDHLRLRSPVLGIRRSATHVSVRTEGRVETFDEVVVACHSDQALAVLEDPTAHERQVLGAFPYIPNTAVLHTDTRILPRRPLAWAAWNYRIPASASDHVTVTYNMNILQRLQASRVFCVSLNPTSPIEPEQVMARFTYHHPTFSTSRDEARHEHEQLIRRNRTSYAGAYWGFGFHEDGVNSALRVCRAFGEEL
jgi:uncharacterized protein